MAGNLMKWWRHKILGGYKQFSVLQESATDSEELIYPMRAPSSCSAPPDLLLTSDREPIASGLMASTPNHHISTTQQQSLKMTNRRESSPANVASVAVGGSHKNHQKAPPPSVSKSAEDDRVHLEEFHCDVSLEHQGKVPQPVQFSFTLYDLDGHGKITKDDIAGIVSTIYESLGKSIVVPHYGSKTINVRLTVSPDAKIKTPTKKAALINSRRRYRPRKLLSDDEGSDTSHDNVPIKLSPKTTNARSKSHCSHHNHQPQPPQKLTKETNNQPKDCSTTDSGPEQHVPKTTFAEEQPHLYESINNLKWCSKANNLLQQGNNNNPTAKKSTNCLEILDNKLAENDGNNECEVFCRECTLTERYNLEGGMPVTKQRRRVLRKSRSRKQKVEGASRVRSLSVGNENCLINREKSEEECWKSSLRRRELIEIIRESMEKNRLCFQGNRKPTIDSPRYRHRSHTANDQCGDVGAPTRLENSPAISPDIVPTNLCGYDSFLHATICSNLNNNLKFTPTVVPTAAINLAGVTPVRNNSARMARNRALRQHDVSRAANPMGYMRLQAPTKTTNTATPKMANNKGVESKKLISSDSHAMKGKTKARVGRLQRSKSKEELFTSRDTTAKIEDILNAEVFLDKLKITEEVAEKCVESPRKNVVKRALKSPINQAKSPTKGLLMEYATIPVNADPAECENLLKSPVSDGDDPKTGDSSTVHRYVHEHIHHHYHHFEETSSPKI
ncbi:protein naked cuticle [Lutzomyia longipalpis]|uniref:protein naked cuticle n=1 Tax=Lutzomyia longipalpis TaxID=7200 RepID=UPI002483AB79|nr:protein naked cuticle [Lutzomyia longipalpis]XP_055683201.1 protein naked cuticle [Lutzomyia longipalpis]